MRKNSDEQSRKILSEYNIILQEQSKAYTQKINEETEGLESKLSSIGNFTITLQQVKEELDLYLNDVKKQISSIEEQERLFAVIITILQNSIDDTTEGSSNVAKLIEKLQEAVKKNQIKNDSENGGQQDGQ